MPERSLNHPTEPKHPWGEGESPLCLETCSGKCDSCYVSLPDPEMDLLSCYLSGSKNLLNNNEAERTFSEEDWLELTTRAEFRELGRTLARIERSEHTNTLFIP